MEKKNSQQRDITTELIANIGCNIVLLPTTIVSIGLCVIGVITSIRWYVNRSSPIDIPNYITFIVVLVLLVLGLVAYLWAGWKNILMSYSIIRRYRSMRQEKARIDRLIKSDEAQDNRDIALLTYVEDEAYKELANGKR
jgi:hypothetical protein